MPARPEIFIGATTKDLKSCRQLVRDALLTLGCVPVVQDHFAPEAATVREMLRGRIARCDAVVHLAGECYGYEPRRSYTQMDRRCLEAREHLLGREHPETLQSVNNLAVLLKTEGDLPGAETLYRRCLESYERTLGETHPDTVRKACDLPRLQEKRGHLDEALRLAEKTVAAARVNLPANHPERRRYEQQLADVRAKIASSARPTR